MEFSGPCFPVLVLYTKIYGFPSCRIHLNGLRSKSHVWFLHTRKYGPSVDVHMSLSLEVPLGKIHKEFLGCCLNVFFFCGKDLRLAKMTKQYTAPFSENMSRYAINSYWHVFAFMLVIISVSFKCKVSKIHRRFSSL